jgi:predicted DNA-binding protein (MmcQ/YjbR family)
MVHEQRHHPLQSKPESVIEFPFDPLSMAFKICGKMFAQIMLDEQPLRMNLKCEPGKAQFLHDRFSSIIPSYHTHKNHWNILILNDPLPEELVLSWIDSCALVLQGLLKGVLQSLF